MILLTNIMLIVTYGYKIYNYNFLNQNMLALQEEIEDMEDIKFIVDDFQIIKQRCITIDLEIPVIEVSS